MFCRIEQKSGETMVNTSVCKYESRGMTKTFAKSAWLGYFDSGENYYESPSLEAEDALFIARWSPAQSVDVEINAKCCGKFRGITYCAVQVDDDEREPEDAVGLDEVDRSGVKRLFRDTQEFCLIEPRKVPGTVTEAVELANELF